MPRLIISSLPPDITTSLLTDTLSRPPVGVYPPDTLDNTTPRPTDVKVLMTKQGRSRRMAFVGYKTEAEANWIKDVWQGVWINAQTGHAGGSRIDVQWAKGVEESNVQRTSGKRNKDSKSITHDEPASKRQKVLPTKSNDSDPDFQAFMSTMQPRQHKSLVEDIVEVSATHVPPRNSALSSTADCTTPSVETEALPIQPISASDLPSTSLSTTPDVPPVIDEDDEITEKEYMARRMKRTIGGLDPLPEPTLIQDQPKKKDWDQDEPAKEEDKPSSPSDQTAPLPESLTATDNENTDESTILATGRLFLRNLAFSVGEDDLLSLFSPFGAVSQVHIPLANNQKSKGVAYVTFTRPSDALTAFQQLDQRDFLGRLLHILPAVTRNSRIDDQSGRVGNNVVKQEKDLKRKLESSKQFNWASLYMNSDAVATSIADRLKISKSELYDPDAQNPSVKLALAETHVITETKQYFEEQGIDTEAFSNLNTRRSSTTILVKNIPYGTASSTLKAMFAQHGEVSRILMPPSGTISLVEMVNAHEAKSAFKSLAYKRIGNSVLYLERAPEGIWKRDAPKPNISSDSPSSSATAPQLPVPSAVVDEGEPGSTLFVKNISYSTKSEGLSSAFSTLPDFLFARLQTKPDPKNPNNRLSMGFGFIGFKTIDAARHAVKTMQSYRLDGHALEIRFANRGRDEEERESKPNRTEPTSSTIASTKLLVKNVPFETTKQELRELFGAYGKIKTVRLPKKLDRKTRGFGFVEYTTKKEAEEAMRVLKHTHLLGRHLVISYANDKDEDLDQLRAKSGGHFLMDKVTLQKTKFTGLKETEDDQQVMEED